MNAWTREINTTMKVFSQLYVGLQSSKDKVPLGFATPYETNAAGRKRQDTVNSWCSTYGEWVDGKHVPGASSIRIIENRPRGGFRITDDIKRVYWGGGNVVWRVEDPDGFELEIQSNNLMAIIQTAGINETGLIPGYCIWGRSGGDNILLHEKSDEYRGAVMAAETLKAPKQVSKSTRQTGSAYRLVDGTIGLYLGKVHVCKVDANYRSITAKFPDLPGMMQHAKVIGLLNSSTYELQPSTEFEAVVEVQAQGKLGHKLRLYKKAPLVDFIETMPVKINDAFFDDFDWEFASSSIKAARITSVTVNPILNPQIKLLPWTEKQYADAKRDIIRHTAADNFKLYGPYYDWFRPNRHAVILDKMICGDIGLAGTFGGISTCFGIGMSIDDVCYTIVTHTHDVNSMYSTKAYKSMVWRQSETVHIDSIIIVPIPAINSGKTYLEFFDQLYSERALFTIVTRER